MQSSAYTVSYSIEDKDGVHGAATAFVAISHEKGSGGDVPTDGIITCDSPVGTIGMLDGVEGIVVELSGKKVVIATKNFGADTPDACGNYLERKEKKSCNYNGWYIPSLAEFYALFNISEKEWTGTGYRWCFDGSNTSLFMPVTGRAEKRYYTNPFIIWDEDMGYYWVSDEKNMAGLILLKNFLFFESGYKTDEFFDGDYEGIKVVARQFHAMPSE